MEILNKYYFIFLVLTLSACSKGDSGCFTREGDIVTESREVTSPFTSIAIYDNAELTLIQGPVAKIEVTGGEKLISSYITEIDGGQLLIENSTVCKWTRDLSTPFKVSVTVPSLDSILFRGYGNINGIGTFQIDSLTIDVKNAYGDLNLELEGERLNLIYHTGATNSVFKGNVNYVYAFSRSQAIIDMSELHVVDAFYVCSGMGDFKVNTTDYMKVKLDYTGNIYYDNDPEIYIESHLGSGQLIHQ
jgi:hypothetical protein